MKPRENTATTRGWVGALAHRPGLPLGCLAFVLLAIAFTLRGFPIELLAQPLERSVESATGAQLELGTHSNGSAWRLPELRATEARLGWPSGETLQVTSASLRFRPSPRWLLGEPQFDLQLDTDAGQFRGATAPGTGELSGTVRDFDLARLPPLLEGRLALRGRADAEVKLTPGVGPRNGRVAFRAREGALRIGTAEAKEIPFSALSLHLEFDAEGLRLGEEGQFESPQGNARLRGEIRGWGAAATRQLDLEVELSLQGEGASDLLAQFGLGADAAKGRVHISGGMVNPILTVSQGTDPLESP